MKQHGEELFLFGKVVGTHGLRGDLKIRPLSDNSDALSGAREIFFRCSGGEPQKLRPVRVSWHKGNCLLRLEGLNGIDSVSPLVGCEVLMRFSDLPAATEDEFYWFELEGMAVVDRQRGDLGTIAEIFTTAAHDIWVVRGGRGEIMIPAVDAFILEIDREARRLTVALPEGLVPEDVL